MSSIFQHMCKLKQLNLRGDAASLRHDVQVIMCSSFVMTQTHLRHTTFEQADPRPVILQLSISLTASVEMEKDEHIKFKSQTLSLLLLHPLTRL